MKMSKPIWHATLAAIAATFLVVFYFAPAPEAREQSPALDFSVSEPSSVEDLFLPVSQTVDPCYAKCYQQNAWGTQRQMSCNRICRRSAPYKCQQQCNRQFLNSSPQKSSCLRQCG